ncbi:multidrug transporter [Neofusicoccum ribis]|uniref:Multidrug transporter n=1 Tax=Neofusicoccum ribis TaxID=45134 RepID=A0ABR3T0V1_9PEZI
MASEKEESPAYPRSFYLALASLFLVPFSASVNAVILSSALPAITSALEANSSKAFWCGTGFQIARTVTTPVFGAFSEAFGRRNTLSAALIVFSVATAFCAAAQNIDWLLAARVVQGASAGGLNAVVGVVITDMIELRNRGKVTGIFAFSQFLGLPGGLLLGGVITQYSSWRWIFVISIPVCLIAMVGILLFLDLEPPEATFVVAVKSMDWGGMVLLCGAVTALMYGLTTGGTQNPWKSAKVIATIIIGALGMIAFSVYEWYHVKPMIPPRLFANRTSAVGFGASFLHGFIFWAMSSYMILYFISSLDHSLFRASLDCLPGIGMLVVSSASSGFIYAKLKRFQKILNFAWALVVVGTALLSTLRPNSGPGKYYGYQVIASIGGGMILPGRLLSVQASQKPEDVAMATTTMAFMLSIGQAFGMGIGGSVIQNRWDDLVNSHHIPSKYNIPSSKVESAYKLAKAFPEKIQRAYGDITAKSIATLFIFCCALSAVGFLTSFISKDLSLDKDERGRQRFRGGKKKRTEDVETPSEQSTDTGVRVERSPAPSVAQIELNCSPDAVRLDMVETRSHRSVKSAKI